MLKLATTPVILFWLFLIAHPLKAQVEWAPVGATWHYTFHHAGGDTEYLELRFKKDTLINGDIARVLSQTIHRVDGELDNSLGNLYMYQDENQIYLWIRGRFELLYDFDAEVGDTLQLLAPMDTIYFPEEDSLMYFRVDSIKTFEVDGQDLRGQYLDPIDKGAGGFAVQFSGWNLEKVGNQHYFIAWNQLECDNECADVFRCYADNSISYKVVDYPCDTILARSVSTRESEVLGRALQVNQNPIWSGGWLEFSVIWSSDESIDIGPMTYEIRDLSGRRMVPLTKMSNNQDRLSTVGFTPGMYILIVRSRKSIAQQRIVIY